MDKDWQQEGAVRFQVGNAFFRQASRVGRDLGVLAATLYRQQRGQLQVLDGMSGCGVRSLRYAQEAQADCVWANEANPDVAAVLQHNLATQLSASQFQVTIGSAKQVLARCLAQPRYFDLIDLDAFGSPSAEVGLALQVTRKGGLLYVTGTDSRTYAGHNPAASLRQCGAYARSHPAVHEQGLRLLLGNTLQQALFQGWAIAPVFSLFYGQTYRIMVRLIKALPCVEDQYGFIGHCHGCGHFETVHWRGLSRAMCHSHSEPLPLTLSGPMWLGPLHDPLFLAEMAQLAQEWHWLEQQKLLATMIAEVPFPPYFFTLAEIGRRSKLDIPKREALIAALQEAGYQATATHIEAQALKTDASFHDCLAVAAQLQR
ncbi:MAG TPA: tRNA (guanine-N1)-methyltransferase [Stenomitos sp.]